MGGCIFEGFLIEYRKLQNRKNIMEDLITFSDLGLSDAMLKALEKKGYGYPTTIQQQAIPHFLAWRDVIAKAPTGTGKRPQPPG